MVKILVNGVGGPAGINTIRSLKEMKSLILYGTDADPTAVGLYMLPKKRVFLVPYANDKKFIKTYTKLVKEHEIDWIISTVDEESVQLKKDKHLAKKVICSSLKTLRICRRKDRTYKKLEGIIPVPKWQYLDDACCSPISTYFIKPVTGRGTRDTYKVKGTEVDFIRQKYAREKKKGMLCEYLPGQEYTVDCLGFEGNLWVAVPRTRLKTSGGISMKGRTEKNVEIMRYCHAIYHALKLHGPSCIQFKKSKGGKYKLIEINPRFSGGLEITWLSGVDLPKILVKPLMGKKILSKELKWRPTLVARYATGIKISKTIDGGNIK